MSSHNLKNRQVSFGIPAKYLRVAAIGMICCIITAGLLGIGQVLQLFYTISVTTGELRDVLIHASPAEPTLDPTLVAHASSTISSRSQQVVPMDNPFLSTRLPKEPETHP